MPYRLPLPPPSFRKAGTLFRRDDYFVGSAIIDAERLKWSYGMTADSRILDIGCGPGRTLIGLVESRMPFGSYVGVDVEKKSTDWATGALGDHGEFRHLDLRSERYNPQGKTMVAGCLPIADGSIDIVVCASLFTHLRLADTRIYLEEIYRVLKPGGRSFMTAFVRNEIVVPEVEENPLGYPTGMTKQGGSLHRICYRDDVLRYEIDSTGLSIMRWYHESIHNMQTEIGLVK